MDGSVDGPVPNTLTIGRVLKADAYVEF